MIWLTLVIALGLFIWGVILMREDDMSMGGMFACIIGGLLSLVLLIMLPCTILDNGSTVAEMKIFRDTNTNNYQYSIDETASYLSEDTFTNSLVNGSIEKMQQAGYVSERIKEWRDSVNAYNTKLASLKYYDSNIFMGVLYPNEVQDMKFLVIKIDD